MSDVNKEDGDVYTTMPKRIRIGFSTFQIETMSEKIGDMTGLCGSSHPVQQSIVICEGMNPQQVVNTYLHEVLHAIHWVYGLRNRNEPPTEEEYTNLSANGLCAFWQDNPEVFTWMQKYIAL